MSAGMFMMCVWGAESEWCLTAEVFVFNHEARRLLLSCKKEGDAYGSV